MKGVKRCLAPAIQRQSSKLAMPIKNSATSPAGTKMANSKILQQS
ncbi:MAG: hypothetical protein AAGA50_20800 [Pseudomonadota bacterium]